MSLLVDSDIRNCIEDELKRTTKSVKIITAFCKINMFARWISIINPMIENKSIIVRFSLEDIVSGVTDFSVARVGLEHGWKVYARFDLHAKTYVFDNQRCIIGSANLTKAGMHFSPKPNFEIATLVELSNRDVDKINRLYDGAILLTPSLLDKMEKEVSASCKLAQGETVHWSDEIEMLFCQKVSTLFSYELPHSAQYETGEYIDFLDCTYDGDVEFLKNQLRYSNAFIWLRGVLQAAGGEIYFGRLTAALHDALVEDPKPYRRDVKALLANLLTLISSCNVSEIRIDRPNHSQRVRLVG